MKIKQIILLLLFTVSPNIYSQTETALVTEKMSEIISLVEKGDTAKLMEISTNSMYCLLCYPEDGYKRKNYNIKKKDFYKTHFPLIFTQDLISRLHRNETKILKETSGNSDFVVLYTTHKPNEFGDGNEGAQFGFWFKEEKGQLKLSGVETIP